MKYINKKKEAKIVYEDEKTFVIMSPKPLAVGHLIVFSKEHYETIDEVPADLISHFYYVASFAASAIFESLGPDQKSGTNIVTNDGQGSQNVYRIFTECLQNIYRTSVHLNSLLDRGGERLVERLTRQLLGLVGGDKRYLRHHHLALDPGWC